MGIPLRVLIVEDSAEDAALLLCELRRGGYEPAHERVSNAEEMSRAIDRGGWDIVFCDYSMPHFDGAAALKLLRGKGLDVPFLFVSGTLGEDTAVEAMRVGANDYLTKDHLNRLLPIVERELRESGARQERKRGEEQLRQSEERFRQLAENITEVFWMGDPDKNRVLYISPGYEKIWGRSCESLYQEPKSFLDAVHPDDRERVMKAAMTRQVSGTYDEEYRIIRPDGSVRWIRDRAFPVKDASGQVYRITGIAQDITEQKRTEEALQESQRVLSTLMSNLPGWVYRCRNDKDWTVEFSSDGALDLTGYPPTDFTEGRVSYGRQVIHPDDQESIWNEAQAALEAHRPFQVTYRILTVDKKEKWVWDQGRGIFTSDGALLAIEGFVIDITERKQAEELVQHMAYHDTLTQLPNRNHLYDRLLNVIRTDEGRGNPFALLLMDLDRFKEINDTLGHHRGDLLLQQVGARLRSLLFAPDLVARLGGDEFAVLLPRLAKVEDIHVVIQKIQSALQPPLMIEGLPIVVEASIGVALYPEHGGNPDSLLQRADVAMYTAKQTGRNCVIYDSQYDQHSPRRLALMGELRHAIDHDQLRLHYQPKIDLKSRQVVGVEALVRWQHPEYGFIPPDQFIGPAERTGQIKALTQWVLETALRQCQLWRRSGMGIRISVNLSARNLQEAGLVERVAEVLRRAGEAPDRLSLEITESAIMADPNAAMEVLTRLSQMGVKLSIDDFGTGYSSLAYLKRLPADEIKIDKSFVIGMETDENDAVIVRSTIDLAHNLGRRVVAEGVENQRLWEKLSTLGCDEAQGYYMSRPLPAEDVVRWLSESPWGMKSD
ncbi:MAG: EAL domain-containing protein [Candidatus Manganitrophus sp.]|nr:EAL domain-containing protein [Candidatus Manganitrophus sp.]WDT70895.1 MAG: EAL domain-containing protein [Candidatus Manganitrophus sp.]